MIAWQILVGGVIVTSTISTILSKKTLFKEHAMEFSGTLAVLIGVISLFLIPFLDFNFPRNYWPILYIISIFSTIGFLLIAKSTRHLPVSSSSPLFAFAPVITAILAWFFLKEYLTWVHITGLSLVFVGSYFLEIKPKKSFSREMFSPLKEMFESKYIHFVFLALVLYGASDIIQRFMVNASNVIHMNVPTFFFITHIFMAINFLVLLIIYHDGFAGIKHGLKSSGKLIMLVALIGFIGRILTVYAVSNPLGQVALVTALKRSSIVLSTFFGGELFKEKHLKQKTLASLLMVMGAIMLAI